MSEHKPYTIKLFPDEPILVIETLEGYSARTHLGEIIAQAREILDAAPEPLALIHLIDAVPATIDDAIVTANIGARGDDPIWKHPNIRDIIWVTTNRLARLGIKGLESEIFGNLSHITFDTMEEALAYVRDEE